MNNNPFLGYCVATPNEDLRRRALEAAWTWRTDETQLPHYMKGLSPRYDLYVQGSDVYGVTTNILQVGIELTIDEWEALAIPQTTFGVSLPDGTSVTSQANTNGKSLQECISRLNQAGPIAHIYEPKCECGADKVRSFHSSWCPKGGRL